MQNEFCVRKQKQPHVFGSLENFTVNQEGFSISINVRVGSSRGPWE